jgi:hypothetical protein
MSTPLTAFAVGFMAALVVALVQGPKQFYYDSGGYWNLGATFTSHGHFSLTNFDSPLRGYILPLIYHGLNELAVGLGWTDSSTVKLFNAILFSLIGAVLIPRVAEITWPERHWSVSRRISAVALLLIFWSGYLNFPLSDIPGLAMALLAILAASRPSSAWRMFLVGVATAVTIEIRPSYVLIVPIVLVLAAWGLFDQRDRIRNPARSVLYLGLAIAGFAIVSLPQSLSAHRHFGTYSFVPGSADGLEYLQLTEGIRIQLYGTYIGHFYGPQMNYVDEAGNTLLHQQSNPQIRSVSQYFGMIVDHPLTFAGIFARHIVNGLDVRYSAPYAEHLRTDWWLRIGGFALIFAGLLRVLWPKGRRSLGPSLWRYPAAILACCLVIPPTAVETRYMLPVFVLSYMLVLTPGWPTPIAADQPAPRRYRVVSAILVAYLIFMVAVWHVTSDTSHDLRLRSAAAGEPDLLSRPAGGPHRG